MFAKIYNKEIKIDYNNVDGFNRYPTDLKTEYIQSVEEGLDIEKYKSLFDSVADMPNGEGDFGKSICFTVGMAFDADCNGATVGSVLGMRNTADGIDEYWKKPVNGKIHTSIFGVETVDIKQAVVKTLKHIY